MVLFIVSQIIIIMTFVYPPNHLLHSDILSNVFLVFFNLLICSFYFQIWKIFLYFVDNIFQFTGKKICLII